MALLDAMDKGTVPASDLSLDQAQQLTNHPDKKLAERARVLLARGGRLPSPDRQKVLDEYMPLVEKTGDPRKGFEVFKNICAKCHRHGDTGETIAPNLTGFNVHPKSKILQKMLDPNRSVEGNYRQYTVTTKAGRVFNGLLASETKTAIEVVDTEAKRHVILREDIEEMLASNRTIMPEGFEKQLSKDDFVNVLEFLTAKGKYVPIPLDTVATIVSTQGMFYSKDAGAERLIFRDWTPKTFNGVPFQLVDPQKGRVKNVILLHSSNGEFPPKMPKSVALPCNTAARAIHFLSGVSGWGCARRRERLRVDDRAPALRRRQDGGPSTQERRAVRRLHPPRGRAGIAVRLRAARPADSLSRGDAAARGDNQGNRAAEGTGSYGARRHGRDGRDTVTIGCCCERRCAPE